MIKLIIACNGKTFNIKVHDSCTVSHLIIKIRKFLAIKSEEAVFLFFEYDGLIKKCEKIFPQTHKLIDIKNELNLDVLYVKVMKENCFGSFSKIIKSEIEKHEDLYLLKITYSYYLYTDIECFIFSTMEEAKNYLLALYGNFTIKH